MSFYDLFREEKSLSILFSLSHFSDMAYPKWRYAVTNATCVVDWHVEGAVVVVGTKEVLVLSFGGRFMFGINAHIAEMAQFHNMILTRWYALIEP